MKEKIRPHCLTLAGAWTSGAGRLAVLPKHVAEALNLINICLEENPDAPDLWLKKASVLGLQAKYKEASEILLKLNRQYPKKPAILKRLALVFELLRDQGKYPESGIQKPQAQCRHSTGKFFRDFSSGS